MQIKSHVFYYAVILLLLCVVACDAASERKKIVQAKSFDSLVHHLSNDDIEIVAFALWHMETIDDNRVPDLFISIWEKDGKYRDHYDKDIEENILIKMTCAQALIQFGYFFSNDAQHYLLSKTTDTREHVRKKAAELLASAGSVPAVKAMIYMLENDTDRVSISAFESLLLVANKRKRLLDKKAVLSAQEYIRHMEDNLSSYSSAMQNYIQNIGQDKYDFDTALLALGREKPLRYKSIRVYPDTLRLLQPYIDSGDLYAMYLVGKKYLDGDEVKKDPAKGETLLLESAENGYAYAYYELAKRYRTGNGVSKNTDKEFLYRKLYSETKGSD